MQNEIPHNHLIDRIALWNGLISGVTLYPQLYLMITGQYQIGNLSGLSFALILLNSLVWLIYGAHRNIIPLVISSFLNAVAAALILSLI